MTHHQAMENVKQETRATNDPRSRAELRGRLNLIYLIEVREYGSSLNFQQNIFQLRDLKY